MRLYPCLLFVISFGLGDCLFENIAEDIITSVKDLNNAVVGDLFLIVATYFEYITNTAIGVPSKIGTEVQNAACKT